MEQLNIILGNFDDTINEILTAKIEKAVKGRYRLNIASFFYIEDIDDYARRHPIDLFVIVVNNIRLYENASANHRIEKALQFITELKHAHNQPVIALFGWPDDPHFSEELIQAGANSVFKIPFKTDNFEAAVRACLGIVKEPKNQENNP